MRDRFGMGVLAALLVSAASAAPAQLVPATPPLVLAADPDAANSGPAVGADPVGNLWVAWSHRSCTDGVCDSKVHARRLDASGQPLGDEFRVSPNRIQSTPFAPLVAVNAAGTALIVWPSVSLSGRGAQVRGRCFDAAGNQIRTEIGISNVPATGASSPYVTALADGGFVVWRREGDSQARITARRFDAACAPQGPEFTVDPRSPGWNPTVAAEAGGGFLIVWQEVSAGGNDLVGQLYDEDGNRVGRKVALPDRRRSRSEMPVAAGDPRGGFAVAWRNRATGAIRLRRFDAGVKPLGPEVPINTAGDAVSAPRLTFDAEGSLLVSWVSSGSALGCCFGRWFDPSGRVQGQVFAVAPLGAGRMQAAATGAGTFFAVWERSPREEGQQYRILGQGLERPQPPRR